LLCALCSSVYGAIQSDQIRLLEEKIAANFSSLLPLSQSPKNHCLLLDVEQCHSMAYMGPEDGH
jgi:hypothetical protein